MFQKWSSGFFGSSSVMFGAVQNTPPGLSRVGVLYKVCTGH